MDTGNLDDEDLKKPDPKAASKALHGNALIWTAMQMSKGRSKPRKPATKAKKKPATKKKKSK